MAYSVQGYAHDMNHSVRVCVYESVSGRLAVCVCGCISTYVSF